VGALTQRVALMATLPVILMVSVLLRVAPTTAHLVGEEAARRSEWHTAALSLADRPSHDGLYRARMLSGTDRIAIDEARQWLLEVRTPDGRMVRDAEIEVESWMPETGVRARLQPGVEPGSREGTYVIEGLRLDEPGWWNVKVEIAAGAGTDSLAFNLILQ
jgi:hypothetical protein